MWAEFWSGYRWWIARLGLCMGVVMAFASYCGIQHDLCTGPTRIETVDQALDYAAVLIERSHSDTATGAGFANARAYVEAIRKRPNCCSANYGKGMFTGWPAWDVVFSSIEPPLRYNHEVEFSRCRHLYYDAGMSQ